MAYDLILGRTRRNWARGCAPAPRTTSRRLALSDDVDFRLSPDEMKMVSDVAATKVSADAGDPRAKKKMVDLKKKVSLLERLARKGNPQAKRTLEVLQKSGVFNPTQTVVLGYEMPIQTTIDHDDYRVAVLRQAQKLAKMSGASRPTTKDFYLAKKAVDGTMSRYGISLYLPGSRSSRLTV